MTIPKVMKKKFLNDIEKEIIHINDEQKIIFNRLRLIIDYFLLQNKIERKKLTDFVSSEIASYAKQTINKNLIPINVKCRVSLNDLYEKYNNNANRNNGDDCNVINLDDDEENDDKIKSKITVGDENEIMEVLVSPEDVALGVNYVDSSYRQLPKQESLLKPKSERISLPKEVKENPKPGPQINMSRLKLKEALFKAKIKKLSPEKPVKKSKSISPEAVCAKNVKSPVIETSQSSSASSEDIFESIDWAKEEEQPTELGKEAFMRIFGLYTHTYSHYLIKRRTERKRRNCTSTEHRDYYYSKLELFEKQYAKRSKRQFLYSPPATRAKKQRRVNSDGELIVNNTNSNNNGRTNTDKVCVTCFKKSKFPFKCFDLKKLKIKFSFFFRSSFFIQIIFSSVKFALENFIYLVTIYRENREIKFVHYAFIHVVVSLRKQPHKLLHKSKWQIANIFFPFIF